MFSGPADDSAPHVTCHSLAARQSPFPTENGVMLRGQQRFPDGVQFRHRFGRSSSHVLSRKSLVVIKDHRFESARQCVIVALVFACFENGREDPFVEIVFLDVSSSGSRWPDCTNAKVVLGPGVITISGPFPGRRRPCEFFLSPVPTGQESSVSGVVGWAALNGSTRSFSMIRCWSGLGAALIPQRDGTIGSRCLGQRHDGSDNQRPSQRHLDW